MDIWDKLNGLHLDALKEIGNIGAGNAARALADLLNKPIRMKILWAGIVPFNELTTLIGQEEEPIVCVKFNVDGQAPSKILFLLNEPSAHQLVDILLGPDQSRETGFDEMGCSVLQEVSNILTGNYLSAFAEFCQLRFSSSVPAFAFDMLGAVLTSALLEEGYFSERVLVIETEFYGATKTAISAHFFLIPETDSLGKILVSLGLQVE